MHNRDNEKSRYGDPTVKKFACIGCGHRCRVTAKIIAGETAQMPVNCAFGFWRGTEWRIDKEKKNGSIS